ncbi:MAG: hypothetical protein ACYC6L_16960 [Anaerolineae bacterium]
MSYQTLRDISEWLASITFVAGIVTAILNLNLAGFTPLTWFIISGLLLLLIICTEVSRVREALEKKG